MMAADPEIVVVNREMIVRLCEQLVILFLASVVGLVQRGLATTQN